MSDRILKIVPSDHTFKTDNNTACAIVRYLTEKIPADEITFEIYDTPQFADCGENLESIECPFCGAILDMDWWGKAMDSCFEASRFMELEVTVPCCDKTVSLNTLNYNMPCAFTSLEFVILNPQSEITSDIQEAIKSQLGTDIVIVSAHI